MRGRKDSVKYEKFSQPSLFIKTTSLPVSPRVTISVHHTHFLFFWISIFHFYFATKHLTLVQSLFFFFSNSILGTCSARKRVKDNDISLDYHACVFSRNSTPDFLNFSFCIWIVNPSFQKHMHHFFPHLKMYNLSGATLQCYDR